MGCMFVIYPSNSRFRWVECQLETLRKCKTVAHVRKTLKSLPKNLDATYVRILQGIDEYYCSKVRDIFALLAFSGRIVTLGEIVEFVAFNETTKSFNEEEKFLDPYFVLEVCSSLVTLLDHQTEYQRQSNENNAKPTVEDMDIKVMRKELRFAHYSVKEFLVAPRNSTNQFYISESFAHALIAERCVRYLLSHLSVPTELTHESLIRYPFLEYAAVNWYTYAVSVKANNARLNDLMMQFFDNVSNCCLQNWLKVWHPDCPWEGVLPQRQERDPLPIYFSSLTGLVNVTNELVAKGADVNAQGGYFGNALQAASNMATKQQSDYCWRQAATSTLRVDSMVMRCRQLRAMATKR